MVSSPQLSEPHGRSLGPQGPAHLCCLALIATQLPVKICCNKGRYVVDLHRLLQDESRPSVGKRRLILRVEVRHQSQDPRGWFARTENYKGCLAGNRSMRQVSVPVGFGVKFWDDASRSRTPFWGIGNKQCMKYSNSPLKSWDLVLHLDRCKHG